jgi:outer membrane receptor protein involved in Fe transport
LGAEYHLDIDKYGERDFPGNPNVKQNNLRNPNRIVREGDIFGYDYYMNVANANVWAQMHHNYEKVEFYYAAKFTYTGFQRDGKMENGRYPNVLGADGKYITRSYGKGVFHSYYDPSAKAGVVYKITGRHLLSANGIFKMQAPTIYDAYTAPRISDEMLPNLKSEMIGGADLNYVITYPKINARISGYFTEFMNQAQQIAYYNDAYGTFVHHSISDAHTRNYGVEAGLNWKVWKNLTLSVAGTWSQFKYVSNPTTGTIRYENGSEIVTDPKHVNPVIRGFHVGGSPEIAGTISLQYFWKYWWFEISANGFGNSYLAPSFIQRTQDVVTKVADKDPTGKILIAEFEKQNFTPSDYFEDNYFLEQFVNGMEYTKQTRLDKWDWKKFNGVPITMDISISKLFYFKGGKQLNINLNLVNVLNNTGIRTGGYEQGRIPMVRDGFDYDNLNKFPAKYYYMQGINVFLNVGFKF